MTTGITAVGGAATSALPRRLAVVALVAITTFSVARFVSFSPSPSTSTAVPAAGESRIAALEASAERDPENVRTWQQLGVAYLGRATGSADPASYALSTQAFDRADALVPGQADTSVARGALLLSLHQFERARDLVEPISAADPFNAAALTVLVDANVELGQYDTARAVLQQLLDLKPGLPAYSRTSYVRELHGDLVGAEQAMGQARTAGASSSSDVAAVTTFLGDLAFRGGDLVAADGHYRDALRLEPGQGAATFGRAQVLAARGRTDRAIRVLRDLTARVPILSALVLLGELEADAGRPDAAARSFERFRSRIALEREVGAQTDLEIANFEAEHGRPERSLDAARAAYRALPDNIHTADAMAWALLKSGDARAAQPFMVRALRTGSAEAPMHFHAAVIADALGDPETARRELAYVIDRNPFFSFSQRDDARALAARLGVPAPRAWSE